MFRRQRTWASEQAFPGHGQMKPEQLEIARLKREVTKLKAERDIYDAAFAHTDDLPSGVIRSASAVVMVPRPRAPWPRA